MLKVKALLSLQPEVVDLNFLHIVSYPGVFVLQSQSQSQSISLSPASTVSSQILLTHIFLLVANLPGVIGFLTFDFTLGLLPVLFLELRSRFLPRCLSNLTHPTDLRAAQKDPDLFGAFIQTLQLQSSKVSVLSLVWIFLWFQKSDTEW